MVYAGVRQPAILQVQGDARRVDVVERRAQLCQPALAVGNVSSLCLMLQQPPPNMFCAPFHRHRHGGPVCFITHASQGCIALLVGAVQLIF